MEIANMLLWKMTTSKYFYGNRQLQEKIGEIANIRKNIMEIECGPIYSSSIQYQLQNVICQFRNVWK